MSASLVSSTLKFFGKTYTPDKNIPFGYFLKLVLLRSLWLMRGFIRTGQAIFMGARIRIDNVNNIEFGKYCTLDNDIWINAVATGKVSFGENARIGAFSRILCTAHLSRVGRHFRMGKGSGCGEYCFFGAAGGITIGDNVLIGQYVSFHAQNHNFDNLSLPIHAQGTTEKGILVGNDCWIGAKATLLDDTTIGNHCVIAAGAVVSGSFPDHSLIAGVPAKIIRNLKDTSHG